MFLEEGCTIRVFLQIGYLDFYLLQILLLHGMSVAGRRDMDRAASVIIANCLKDKPDANGLVSHLILSVSRK